MEHMCLDDVIFRLVKVFCLKENGVRFLLAVLGMFFVTSVCITYINNVYDLFLL